MIVHSVHGWRHFLVCNTHIAFRLLRRGKKHEITCTSWSFCLWKLCKLVSNIEEHLCIVFMYTGNLYNLHDLATQALTCFIQKIYAPLLFLFLKRRGHICFEWNMCLCLAIWKWLKHVYINDLKCICVWCLDNWFCQVTGKPFKTFSMARLKYCNCVWPSLPFTLPRMHFSFSHHFIPMICDWGIFFYSHDPRFMSLIDSPWFVKFSKLPNFNFRESWFGFFVFSEISDQNPHPFPKFSSMEKVFKIHVDLNLQTFFSSIFKCILGGIYLPCLPLNCHYHQIGFALKQVVPVSY